MEAVAVAPVDDEPRDISSDELNEDGCGDEDENEEDELERLDVVSAGAGLADVVVCAPCATGEASDEPASSKRYRDAVPIDEEKLWQWRERDIPRDHTMKIAHAKMQKADHPMRAKN